MELPLLRLRLLAVQHTRTVDRLNEAEYKCPVRVFSHVDSRNLAFSLLWKKLRLEKEISNLLRCHTELTPPSLVELGPKTKDLETWTARLQAERRFRVTARGEEAKDDYHYFLLLKAVKDDDIEALPLDADISYPSEAEVPSPSAVAIEGVRDLLLQESSASGERLDKNFEHLGYLVQRNTDLLHRQSYLLEELSDHRTRDACKRGRQLEEHGRMLAALLRGKRKKAVGESPDVSDGVRASNSQGVQFKVSDFYPAAIGRNRRRHEAGLDRQDEEPEDAVAKRAFDDTFNRCLDMASRDPCCSKSLRD
jgi:hypothetical protein